MSTPVAYTSLWKVSAGYFQHGPDSNIDSTIETLLRVANVFVSFCGTMWPYILPPLVSILIESPLSLRSWITVQKTAALCPPPILPRPSGLRMLRKHSYTHFAPMYFLLVSLLSSYLHCVVRIPPQHAHFAELAGFGPLFWFATSRLFGLLLRMYKLSVRRDADGDLRIIHTLRPSIPFFFQAIPISLGLLITYNAICFNDSVCKAIVHVAILHIFMSLDARAKESMRAASHYAITSIATLLALIIFLATHERSIKLFVDPSSSQSDSGSGSGSLYPAWDEFISNRASNSTFTRLSGYSLNSDIDADIAQETTGNPMGYRWILFALSVLWNIFPVEFITLCARFDYMRFAKQNGLDIITLPFEQSAPLATHPGAVGLPSDTECGYVSEKEQLELSDGVSSSGNSASEEASDIHDESVTPPPPAYLEACNHTLDQSTELSDLYSQEQITIPLPSSLSLPVQKRVPFPTSLISLSAYLTSTIFLSFLIYFIFAFVFPASRASTSPSHYQLKLVTYMAPLLPIVTLPLTTFATSLGLILRKDGDGLVAELWRYEENWRAEGRRIALETTNGDDV